jgi:uncharacterized protein
MMSTTPPRRIGLISDTHGLLRPEVHTVFAGVEHIVHGGDVGDPDILLELETIAPVTAVWGNVDGMELRARLPERARVTIAGVRIGVIHGQQIRTPGWKVAAREFDEVDVVVVGHSHQGVVERVEGVLVVNPGSAGPARFLEPVTVAILEVRDEQFDARLVELAGRKHRTRPAG